MHARIAATALLVFAASPLRAGPPEENRYDVLGKLFRPFMGVLLDDRHAENRAMYLRMRMAEIEGRLPQEFKGATLEAAVQFPDKLKLVAPVMGQTVTVCRNGGELWATPGAKMEFLLGQFGKHVPPPSPDGDTPLFIPITPMQAAFLPALFEIEERVEIEDVRGVPCRVLRGGLMPELAKSTQSEDFAAAVWVAEGYIPKQIRVTRQDFSVLVDIEELRFGPSLNPAVWEPAPGTKDIYRTSPALLERLLYVVMNSIQPAVPAPAAD